MISVEYNYSGINGIVNGISVEYDYSGINGRIPVVIPVCVNRQMNDIDPGYPLPTPEDERQGLG